MNTGTLEVLNVGWPVIRARWIDRVFDRLTVIDYIPGTATKRPRLSCQCKCGKKVVVLSTNLARKYTKSCGCLNDETRVSANTTHGMTYTKEYDVWKSMIQRCSYEKHPFFKNYGGRGILVCDRWKTFSNFFADMGPRPAKATLERKKNDGNYEPGNCCWASRSQQARNKRSNVLITFRGETKTLVEWSELTGIGAHAISARILRHGYSIEDALTKPLYWWHRQKEAV